MNVVRAAGVMREYAAAFLVVSTWRKSSALCAQAAIMASRRTEDGFSTGPDCAVASRPVNKHANRRLNVAHRTLAETVKLFPLNP
jgi:hypothetical protein